MESNAMWTAEVDTGMLLHIEVERVSEKGRWM